MSITAPLAPTSTASTRTAPQSSVQPLMPSQQRQRVSTPLLAANVALAVLGCAKHSLTATQAMRLKLSSHGVEKAPGHPDLDSMVSAVASASQRIAAATRLQGAEPTRDGVVYQACVDVLQAAFGKMVTVTGWLQGKRTMCYDADGEYRPVKLTGSACPECRVNPEVSSPEGRALRCLNQGECGWRA